MNTDKHASSMRFGYVPSQDPNQFSDTLRESILADSLGYDGVFLTETHGPPFNQPAPLLRLAALATRTNRISLGTSLLLLPLYHPVHVAEEGALVDMISNGRLILGVGLGRVPNWFETFGIPIQHRVSRFEESVNIIRKLWSDGRADFDGKRFSFKSGSLSPRPIQQPGPPIWIGGSNLTAYERAAKLADGIVVAPAASNESVIERLDSFRNGLCMSNKDNNGRDIVLMRCAFTSRNKSKIEHAKEAYLKYFRDNYGRIGVRDVVGSSGNQPQDYTMFLDRFVIGEPEHCIRAIRGYQEMGINYFVIVGSQLPGMPRKDVMESMDLFANEVFPYLR